MMETWKKQFSLEQLSLTHDKPITFVISQWQRQPRPSLVYLVYRWAVALLFFVSIIFGIVDLNNPDATPAFRAKWLIYLTNWGYTMCTLQAVLAALFVTLCSLAPNFETSAPLLQENALKLYKPYWVTNVIATDIAFGITIIYWILIYDEETMQLNAMNFLVHANNSVMMLIDLFVVSHPVRLLHCLYPVLFGLCYAVFSLIFYAAGGISREGHRYIYTILKWSNPGVTTGVCFAVTAFIVILHVVHWALYKLRVHVNSRCTSKRPDDIEFTKAPDEHAKDNPISTISDEVV